jgi:glycosyltransferase involved in cell wall biosynthesis
MKGLSIIIPVHNEEEIIVKNTKKLINFLNRFFTDYEIILCDNGSTDSTTEKGRLLAKKYKKIRFFRIEKRALGLALKEMIKKSRYEKIVYFPMDLSVRLNFVNESVSLLEKYDIVIGSKYMKQSIDKRHFKRKLFGLFFNMLVNLFLKLNISDTQCVKGFRKSRISKIVEKTKSEDLFFEPELLWYAKQFRLKLIEIPVVCEDYRKSKIKIFRDSLKVFLKILNFWRTKIL